MFFSSRSAMLVTLVSIFGGIGLFWYSLSDADVDAPSTPALSSAPTPRPSPVRSDTALGQSFDRVSVPPRVSAVREVPSVAVEPAHTPDPTPTPRIRIYTPSGYATRFPKNTQALQETLCQSKLSPLFDDIEIVLLPTVREPRASIERRRLTMGLNGIGPEEVTALLIHEGSHHYDLTRHRDRSAFTQLSWQTDDIKKPGAQLIDFVSGYALTNSYEDFAESVTFFLLFEREFFERAQKSKVLMEKYRSIERIFGTDEADPLTSYASGTLAPYSWDTTRIPFDQKKYAKEQKMDIMTSSCFEAVEYRGLTPDL